MGYPFSSNLFNKFFGELFGLIYFDKFFPELLDPVYYLFILFEGEYYRFELFFLLDYELLWVNE